LIVQNEVSSSGLHTTTKNYGESSPHCSTLTRIVNDVPPFPEPQKRVLFGDMVLKNSLLARLFSAWNAGL